MFQNESNKLNHIMQNNLIDKQLVDTTMAQCGVSNLDDASIRDTVKIANLLEKATGEKFIRMEMGVPGLAPSRIGTEAEIEALKHGVAQFYPMLEGYPVLSEEASRFVKNFMDVDIRPEGIIPTVGAMQASYVAFMALTECHKGKDTILFIDPGFPVQKTQLEVIGKPYQTFDIYEYREEKLEAKLREYLDRGNIAGIVYSNPNNPSWVCLTDFELQVIGKLATEYDTIILEDLAYFAMDFRKDLSHPGKAPFQPTVAKYTDNYIFMISSSKLFSYAGQRIGVTAISDKLYHQAYPGLTQRYGGGTFGTVYIHRVLYALSSGTSHSAQFALAAMFKAAADGTFDFISEVKEYGRRAERLKKIFTDYGFRIVYDHDLDEPIADGFYFTIAYPGMTGGELMEELIYYGVSAISLSTTGSNQEGLRACTSFIKPHQYALLEERLKLFKENHTA